MTHKDSIQAQLDVARYAVVPIAGRHVSQAVDHTIWGSAAVPCWRVLQFAIKRSIDAQAEAATAEVAP
jgi:alkylated DNA nucleotide flippase Atl1